MKFMYITNSPDVALICEEMAVDRIFIDLETRGKAERQKGLNTVKSNHSIKDVYNIKRIITKSEVLVRINPLYHGSASEIDRVIDAGADVVMLPMAHTSEDISLFTDMVGNRAKTMLLLETRDAEENVIDILNLGRLDEIHIGLNDLSIDYGWDFMFSLLSRGIVESICKKIALYDLPYGFGGVGRIGEGRLPAEKILMEHVRLGSSGVILSRSFCNCEKIDDLKEIRSIFRVELDRIREMESRIRGFSNEKFIENIQDIKRICQ